MSDSFAISDLMLFHLSLKTRLFVLSSQTFCAGHRLLTDLCDARLGHSHPRCWLFAWCYSSVFILSFCLVRSASNFSDIHVFFFFWRINRLTETRCTGSISGSYRRSPQWETSISFLLHPQASPSFLFCRIWIFLTIHKAGTMSLQSPLHFMNGEAVLRQEPQQDGQARRGLQNNDPFQPGGVLAKNLPTLIPHQPTIIKHLFYFKSSSSRFFSRILWGIPRGNASEIWSANSILEFKTLFSNMSFMFFE